MRKSWLTEARKSPLAFAHRGLHGPATGCRENSLSAFLAANDQGVGIELDVQLSKDHVAMVFHDVPLKRLTGKDGKIFDLKADELSHISLRDSNDKILPLRNILAAIDPYYPVLVEIKGDQADPKSIAAATLRAIKDHKGPLAVMSFYPEIIRYFQNTAPEIVRGLVATSRNDGELPDSYFEEDTHIALLQDLEADFIAYDIRALPNKLSDYCHAQGLPLLTWTVRTDEQRATAAKHATAAIFEIQAP